ncbi:hypothetical protein [Pseudomonas tohonis]|uniref:hypothetical protein n=1 Tax=Pseudomonas tohonis TaxID=2725477 RepID=UPI0021D7E413|nr:hypothetical protein [Pseudomonas tohonis]UXY50870.1 hypothetical protein N9L84_18045 [Pseudomonas tohonis]
MIFVDAASPRDFRRKICTSRASAFGRKQPFTKDWFLRRNQHHLKTDGELKINDNALAAIALLVAQSDPRQKELMVHLVMNLIME